MPFTQTTALLNLHSASLINDQISDQLLLEISGINNFPKVGDYRADDVAPTSESHTAHEAMIDFVIEISKNLTSEKFHTLTARLLITHVNGLEENNKEQFLRGTDLAKYFLAYEMSQFPNTGNRHFDRPEVLTVFNNDAKKVTTCKTVLLNSSIAALARFLPLDLAIHTLKNRIQNSPELDRNSRSSIEHIIAQAEKIHLLNNPTDKAVAQTAITQTIAFLNNTITPEQYKKSAQDIQKNPSPALKILAGLMIAAGIALVLTGFFTLGATSAVGAGMIYGGAALTASTAVGGLTGYGLFKKKNQPKNTLANEMISVSKTHKPKPTPTPTP